MDGPVFLRPLWAQELRGPFKHKYLLVKSHKYFHDHYAFFIRRTGEKVPSSTLDLQYEVSYLGYRFVPCL